MRRLHLNVLSATVTFTFLATACHSPLESSRSRTDFRDTVDQAMAQELQGLPEAGATPAAEARPAEAAAVEPENEVLRALAPRRAELDALSPLGARKSQRSDLGLDLNGAPQERVEITLDAVIASVVRNNLGTQASQLQPAISAQEVIIAEAVFDWLLFADAAWEKFDEPQQIPVLGGVPLGTRFLANDVYRFDTGVRKLFPLGTELTIATDLSRFRNNASGISFSPDPAYTGALRLGLVQPLLRGFGTEVNLSTIRIARNQQQRSVQQVRRDLLQVVADAETAYWDLVYAWRNLAIAEWLVKVGEEVRDVLAQRRTFDTKPAQYSDAVATVEQRRADVLRARRLVRQASDALKVIVNDPEFSVASEVALYPMDDPVDAPINYSLRDALLTAMDNRPEIEQAALFVDDESIRVGVAKNQRLPLLNVAAQMAYFGLDDTAGGAYREAFKGDFVDYLVGLSFQYPLGNRAAEANYQAARLRRSSVVLDYRRTVQDVIQDVKSALRDVISNYELILATRTFRVAQAEDLRTLLVLEQTLAALTPEFLNLKFTRQETLASAQRQEVQAQVNFDQSVAQLYRAMGIGLSMKKINVQLEEDQGGLKVQ